MKKQIAKFSFYFVAVGMLAFTGYMTVSFMETVIPNAPMLVKLASLLVFDGGMMAWLVVFTSYAQGTTQRATAILTCLFDFAGVALMVGAEIMTSQSNIATTIPIEEWATWAVAGWTVVNVGALLAFHLSDPETRQEMRKQSRMDSILELANTMLDQDLERDAIFLADQLRGRQKNEFLAGLNLQDVVQSIITPQPQPVTMLLQESAPDAPPLVMPPVETVKAEPPANFQRPLPIPKK